MKVSIFLTSFFSTYLAGSKFLISAAILVGKSVVSNRVMGPTPDLPLRRHCQVSRVPIPTAVTRQTPVMTTRRFTILLSLALVDVRIDIVDGILHGLDFLSVLVVNFHAKSLFECHYQVNVVHGI